MARKNESPQKAAMREMMSVILEDVLDEELGYSKYDYRNKDTDNNIKGYCFKKAQYPMCQKSNWIYGTKASL